MPLIRGKHDTYPQGCAPRVDRMTGMSPRFALLSLLLLFVTAPLRAADIAGDWHGEIDLPQTKLEIQVQLKNDAGAWTGTISIPAQMLRNYALSPVGMEGDRVTFAMPDIPGDPTFTGTVSTDGATIAGEMTQGGQTFPFTLARGAITKPGHTPNHGVPGEGLVGHWQGTLQAGPMELRLALHVTQDDLGDLSATLDSLDQNAFGIPIDHVALNETTVILKLEGINATYDGALSAEGAEIVGTWSQGATRPLTFYRLAGKPELRRPQEPTGELPYDVEDVRFPNENAGISLAGTLTLPQGEGPFPAVILVTGSGAQDRDESLMGHRPFLVLADHLTRRGIAVLRYDDRGVAESEGDFSAALQADFAGDAHAALTYLRTRDEIDANRLGVIGHSEGGIVAPRVASEDDDVSFIVLLAGVGVPLEELLQRQLSDILTVAGAPESVIEEQLTLHRQIVRLAHEQGDTPEARAEAARLLNESVSKLTEAQRKAMGVTNEMIKMQVRTMFSPWYRELSAYDPRPWLMKVDCPVLAINGELDMQVAADDNLEAIRAALEAGHNPPATITKLPGLNHLFQPATTGGMHEYAQIETTIDPSALNAISDWIETQVARER